MNKSKRIRPIVDEERGRKFAATMRYAHNWRDLTGEQIEQVLKMADTIHTFMRSYRKERTDNP